MGITYQGILRSEEKKFCKLGSFFRKSIMQRLERHTEVLEEEHIKNLEPSEDSGG
jgi:hypothetical protein